MPRSSCGFSKGSRGCLVAGGPQVGDHDAGPGVFDAVLDRGSRAWAALVSRTGSAVGIGSGTQTDG